MFYGKIFFTKWRKNSNVTKTQQSTVVGLNNSTRVTLQELFPDTHSRAHAEHHTRLHLSLSQGRNVRVVSRDVPKVGRSIFSLTTIPLWRSYFCGGQGHPQTQSRPLHLFPLSSFLLTNPVARSTLVSDSTSTTTHLKEHK